MSETRLLDQARANSHLEIHLFEAVMHFLFAVEVVFPKYLERMIVEVQIRTISLRRQIECFFFVHC